MGWRWVGWDLRIGWLARFLLSVHPGPPDPPPRAKKLLEVLSIIKAKGAALTGNLLGLTPFKMVLFEVC